MRVRSLVTTFVATAAFLGVATAPASAGTGPSQWCTDGVGWLSLGPSSPVTVAVEWSRDPLNVSHQTLVLCYSTSATSTPGSVIGGAIVLEIYTNTTTVNPGAHVAVHCVPDWNVVVGPVPPCYYPTGIGTQVNDVYTPTAGGACLVTTNGVCQVFVPGLAAYTNWTGNPLLSVTLLGVDVTGLVPGGVNLPWYCVGVLSGC